MKINNMLRLLGIMALVLVVAIPMISSAAAQSDVCRQLPATAAPGDEITVELDITAAGDATKLIIEDAAPAGWTVTGADNGGTPDGDTVRWIELAKPADGTYSYTVQIPGDATPGMFDFAGEFDMGPGVNVQDISCDTQVEVVEGGAPVVESDVCRSLPATAAPGDEITVELDITAGDDATKLIIEDAAPAGWTVIGADNGGTPDDGSVRWVELSAPADGTYSYTVQIPGDATPGMFDFAGEFDMGPGVNVQDISCDTQVEVTGEAPVNGESDVCRNLPATAAPGDEITVELDITAGDDATKLIIEDTAPAGWTVTSANNGGTPDGDMVRWVELSAPADGTYSYTVQIPGDATPGMFDFAGEFDMGPGVNVQDISCDTQVEIPPVVNATRDIMPDPAEVGPCDEFNVSVTVEEDGVGSSVVETIPEGFEYVSSTLGVPNSIVDGNEVTFILDGETSFEYTVSAANEEGTYTFDGVVVDTEMNEYPVGGETTIDVVLPEGIAIQPGWNFMSVPFELNNSSVGYVLADVNYDALVYYNASSGTWDTVTDFEPLKGYWIKSSDDCTQVIAEDVLEPEVPSAPASMTVYEGWNTIGYTALNTLSAEVTLASIDESYTLVKGPYDPATMSYEMVGHNGETGVISGNHVGTDVFEMEQYEAYWVYVTQEDNLNGF
ncbi:COG1470 family protein [Methanohalophilus mahii]|uniref:Uncharacterized protein n=1 Tax=Methanohalophilus mahii (strain ATCC 35705 / DSM 5219 / SLP) TaxID=547558 RepID=D5E791_METMS|nr:hypothetical protein [Methanohalophilus mahii]ADE37029.1 hypothetical protein Mmah_1533 [Methanohalophilus mahii DSM 5219]